MGKGFLLPGADATTPRLSQRSVRHTGHTECFHIHEEVDGEIENISKCQVFYLFKRVVRFIGKTKSRSPPLQMMRRTLSLIIL